MRLGLRGFSYTYVTFVLAEHMHILEPERLAMHCDILLLGGMLNERCWAPGREDALPISQSASTWGISHRVVSRCCYHRQCAWECNFCTLHLPLYILHPEVSMQSVGPIVFRSSPLKSDNHTNGHVNRRNENSKKKLCSMFVHNALTSVWVELKSFIFLFSLSHTLKPIGKYMHQVP